MILISKDDIKHLQEAGNIIKIRNFSSVEEFERMWKER